MSIGKPSTSRFARASDASSFGILRQRQQQVGEQVHARMDPERLIDHAAGGSRIDIGADGMGDGVGIAPGLDRPDRVPADRRAVGAGEVQAVDDRPRPDLPGDAPEGLEEDAPLRVEGDDRPPRVLQVGRQRGKDQPLRLAAAGLPDREHVAFAQVGLQVERPVQERVQLRRIVRVLDQGRDAGEHQAPPRAIPGGSSNGRRSRSVASLPLPRIGRSERLGLRGISSSWNANDAWSAQLSCPSPPFGP